MTIKPILDKWELKGIQHINTTENRALVEHKIPGLSGSFLQDMGEMPTSVIIYGTLHGDEVRDEFLGELRKKFVVGKPVPFMADIIAETDVKEVIITELQVSEVAGSPDQCRYQIKLTEYISPPESSDTSAIADVQKDVEADADSAIQGKIEDIQAEGTLGDAGLDVDKADSFMNNVDSDKLNSFMDDLGPQGLDKFGEVVNGLGLDAVNQLASSLGLNLPLGGYEKAEDVFRDLVGGVEGMVSGDPGDWGPAMGASCGKMVGKLLLTVVGGGEKGVDWGGLTDTFKDALGDLF